MARSVWTKTNAGHQMEGFAEMVTISTDVYKKFIKMITFNSDIMTMTIDVFCMSQIKVPALIKRVVLNAHAQQALHQVLSEYVKILMNASKIMSCVRLDATILPVQFNCNALFRNLVNITR